MKTFTPSHTEHEPEACSQRLSGLDDALYAIGGKWKLRILHAMQGGKKRFNELQRNISKISARVLSNELKDLEQNGFIKRHIFTGMPVVVDYELTEYSATLSELLTVMSAWGIMHRERTKEKFQAV
jgi:DNA-binding HxlR family transcriptional regulator